MPTVGLCDLLLPCREVLQRTVEALKAEGRSYIGVLYGGFMLTKDRQKMNDVCFSKRCWHEVDMFLDSDLLHYLYFAELRHLFWLSLLSFFFNKWLCGHVLNWETANANLSFAQDGPMLLEYNCRFGDPETQALNKTAIILPEINLSPQAFTHDTNMSKTS